VTQSHLTIGHLTLFPIFSRPFGLPLLYILYYIYKPTQLHHICVTNGSNACFSILLELLIELLLLIQLTIHAN
jgi:hypothetical protein